ncbi:hypothetical protein [Aeoliella sp. SH292]|uniref:hypothetical protein n=1 Tax=Aeoliella sp. SH292 TaxID=3454464 RepID=UPI003F9D2DB2
MAFIKLLPPKGSEPHSVARIVELLHEEFDVFESDAEAGMNQVDGMLAATLRFPDSLPGKQERLAWLRSVQNEAVMVAFSDGSDAMAQTCVMPDSELFFGSPDAIDGAARKLVDRAAAKLGYEIFEG